MRHDVHMTTTRTLGIRTLLTLSIAFIAGAVLSSTPAHASTPGSTKTCTTVTVTTPVRITTDQKCKSSTGAATRKHSVKVKAGNKSTTTSDSVSLSVKGTRTVTHTVTVSISGKTVSQVQVQTSIPKLPSSVIPHCAYEDASGPNDSPACRWDAAKDGLANGGNSFTAFTVKGARVYVYDDGTTERETL